MGMGVWCRLVDRDDVERMVGGRKGELENLHAWCYIERERDDIDMKKWAAGWMNELERGLCGVGYCASAGLWGIRGGLCRVADI